MFSEASCDSSHFIALDYCKVFEADSFVKLTRTRSFNDTKYSLKG